MEFARDWPGSRSLVDELLAKRRSVDAIGEEECRRALGEPIFATGVKPPAILVSFMSPQQPVNSPKSARNPQKIPEWKTLQE
jgi:hypothetical protein